VPKVVRQKDGGQGVSTKGGCAFGAEPTPGVKPEPVNGLNWILSPVHLDEVEARLISDWRGEFVS
jgi:hypothetical protein